MKLSFFFELKKKLQEKKGRIEVTIKQKRKTNTKKIITKKY